MKFFIDTANVDEIKQARAWGILDGVTTNPSLIAKEGIPHKQRVMEIIDIVGTEMPVSAECVETDLDKLMKEAQDIASWSPNIYVKVPMNENSMEGAHIATIPFKTMEMLFKHPLTDIGIKRFNDDYLKSTGGDKSKQDSGQSIEEKAKV